MSSSSVLRSVGALAASAVLLPSMVQATSTYKLATSWEGENILDHFNFFDRADPTNGFVTYVNQSYAENSGLAKITDTGSLYLGVDYDTVLSPSGPGRESIRIESNEYFDQGLYVFDIQHMPGSICGTWPAFWTVGPNWPYDGEIDFIEGVNLHEANKIVLHTSGSCDVGGGYEMSGDLTSSECGDASGTIGCVVSGEQGSSGTPFNKQGGGVYAMEWQAEYLKIWFFPRASIPASITAGSPDTSEFGTPMAHLQGSCDFQERFTHQKLILDTTFCGEWAGAVYGDSGCPLSDASNPMQSCINYVAENPAKFKEAYWELNYIKIYQTGIAGIAEATETAASTSSTTKTEVAETTTTTTTTKTTTSTAEETALPSTTSTTTVSATSTTTTTTTTAPAASAPSDVAAEEVPSVSKITSFVTITTTLCPVESLQTAAVIPESSSEAPVVETTSTPAAAPPATTESAVEVPAPPATVSPSTITSHPVIPSSVPPTSIIYTAPEGSSFESWEIVSSSSEFVTVPTAASPITTESPDYSDYPSSIIDTDGTPTLPSSPVFTGAGSRLSINVAAIIGAVALILLV
ncbi:Endo-1,3(4)-beta-glucanase xgeA [Aspergillus ustus]|uniref:endo-1,3(4)-beta-glucanase n=1 Tax=Aspergillus ustus TaxID=40382 RepID=A0A0C1EH64_ASPUT|nr:Endo-1,3(4)-beta-glucanase xgeA [Aspergillus ustus]